ncbi:MAG: hypothetical protein IPG96_09020 [Proteobacteria bacterium]|nr:hypothetical protein [Pseudomonadota bacterium]
MAMRYGALHRGLLALALTLLAPVGCKQGENDRCQVDDDCSGALRCCRRDDPESLIIGGVCTRPAACELTRDARVPDAAGTRDARGDTGVSSAREAGPADRGTPDAAPRDARAVDARVKTDARGPDAMPPHDGH